MPISPQYSEIRLQTGKKNCSQQKWLQIFHPFICLFNTNIPVSEKRIKDKEIIGYFYYDAFRNIKRMEQFEKNLGEVIIDSLTNFNNFTLNFLQHFY